MRNFRRKLHLPQRVTNGESHTFLASCPNAPVDQDGRRTPSAKAPTLWTGWRNDAVCANIPGHSVHEPVCDSPWGHPAPLITGRSLDEMAGKDRTHRTRSRAV